MVVFIVVTVIIIVAILILMQISGDIFGCIRSRMKPLIKSPRRIGCKRPNPTAELNQALQEANIRAFRTEQDLINEAIRHMNFVQESENRS